MNDLALVIGYVILVTGGAATGLLLGTTLVVLIFKTSINMFWKTFDEPSRLMAIITLRRLLRHRKANKEMKND